PSPRPPSRPYRTRRRAASSRSHATALAQRSSTPTSARPTPRRRPTTRRPPRHRPSQTPYTRRARSSSVSRRSFARSRASARSRRAHRHASPDRRRVEAAVPDRTFCLTPRVAQARRGVHLRGDILMRTSPWLLATYIAIILFGLLAALPNVLGPSQRARLPDWLHKDPVTLGLDLRGGSQLVLE